MHRPGILRSRLAVSCIVCLASAFLASAPRLADGGDLCGYTAIAPPAVDESSFDRITGRDPRNYPPDPEVEFKHIKLDLQFDDLMSRSFRGGQTITFRTLGRPIERLELNAIRLAIHKVTDAAGKPLSFRYDDQRLMVRFPAPMPPEADGTIRIEYECRNPRRGMMFALPDQGYPNRPVSIRTHGEAEDNRYWFVSHDFPNARCTTEMLVAVPSKYVALSNGKLIERKELDGGLVQYHYMQEQPHVSYLVSLVIGEYEIVGDQWHGIPVEYYVPHGQEAAARRTFGKTPKMIDLYSKLTGIDYPYAKYAQAVCYEHGGGMENTTATTMHEMILLDERAAIDQDEESLISHELSHQWFGDMVTCKSWPHIWLNEGFGTFMAHVWEEHERGPDEYAYEIFKRMRDVAKHARPDARAGMVYHEYNFPGELFWKPESNPYVKGACVLHMLRCSLGDELFWRSVREFLKRYAWKSAETDDFRKVIEELSGRSFERFFQQWVYRPGVPKISATYTWDDKQHEVRLTLEQTQDITRDAPAFAADVDVWLVFEGGSVRKCVIPMSQRFAGLTSRCESEPAQVCIDPNGALLANIESKLPVSLLVRQATSGPTPFARLSAVAALADKDDAKAREALKAILLDEKANWGLRAEAAGSLGTMQRDEARDILLAALADANLLAEHRVRAAAALALGRYRGERVVSALLPLARKDVTYTVEAAATEALGKQEPADAVVEVLLANCRKASHKDQIRQAAVQALAELDEVRGIAPAMELAAYGSPCLSRPAGIKALGRLGRIEGQQEKVRKFLVPLLRDRQERSVWATIDALAQLADRQAVPALQALADSSAWPPFREAARKAITTINSQKGESDALCTLRERVDKLDKAREDIEKRLSAMQPAASGPAPTSTQSAPK